MNLLSIFARRDTGPVARERLQILLAHERTILSGKSDLVALLREEILAVIAKHLALEQDNIQIKMDRGASVSTLEVGIEIPTQAAALLPDISSPGPGGRLPDRPRKPPHREGTGKLANRSSDC